MSTEEGLFIEFIEEQEVKADYGLKNPEIIARGKVIIRNRTGGALSDLELELENTENVNLEKKIFIGVVKDGEDKVIEYTITGEGIIGLRVLEDLKFPPEIPTPFALKCESIKIQ